MKRQKDKVISTRVDAATRAKLDELCKALDRPQAWVISALLSRADASRLEELSQGMN